MFDAEKTPPTLPILPSSSNLRAPIAGSPCNPPSSRLHSRLGIFLEALQPADCLQIQRRHCQQHKDTTRPYVRDDSCPTQNLHFPCCELLDGRRVSDDSGIKGGFRCRGRWRSGGFWGVGRNLGWTRAEKTSRTGR
jgi:hypothetical protein